MNPLEVLNDDCIDFFLRYLTVRDLLKCSLLSRQWNQVIGKSSSMARIWLRFYEPFDDVKVLLESSRQYKSFKTQRGVSEKIIPVLKKYKWKHIMMRDDETTDYYKFLNLMTELSPTVESIDLWDVGTQFNSETEFVQIHFKRLKTLEINLTNRAIFSTFLGSNPRLKTLIIRNESAKFSNAEEEIMRPTNLIFELLQRNKIERLKLMFCDFALEHDLMQGLANYLKTLTVTLDSRLGANTTATSMFIRSERVKGVRTTETSTPGISIVTVKYMD